MLFLEPPFSSLHLPDINRFWRLPVPDYMLKTYPNQEVTTELTEDLPKLLKH